jgi:hypothetical protein
MRRDVMDTLAVFSDVEYQWRAWVRREGFGPGQYDDFDYHIHVLYDDTSVLPDPDESLGTVLLPGDEIGRIRELGVLLDELLRRHGDASSEDFISDTQWPAVVKSSSVALAAMVRAWGF